MHSLKSPDQSQIKNIIFDLGKVIISVDHDATFGELKKLSDSPTHNIDRLFSNQFILDYELGKITEQQFLLGLAERLSIKNDRMADILLAWNKMIIGIPSEGIMVLRELKSRFNLIALSNTNSSHVKIINQFLETQHNARDMHALFDKVYYSYLIGLEKPDQKTFEFVLQESNISPNETLVIDDKIENIDVSKNLGFHTLHLIEQSKLKSELEKMGIY